MPRSSREMRAISSRSGGAEINEILKKLRRRLVYLQAKPTRLFQHVEIVGFVVHLGLRHGPRVCS